MAKKKKGKTIVPRDGNILLHQKGEINLSSKTIQSAKQYTRKKKHKNKE